MKLKNQGPVGVRSQHVQIIKEIARNLGTPGGPLDLIPPCLRSIRKYVNEPYFDEDSKNWALIILRLLKQISALLSSNITIRDIQSHIQAAYEAHNLDRETRVFEYEILLQAYGSLSVLAAASLSFDDSRSLESLLDAPFVELLKQTVGNNFRFINRGYVVTKESPSYAQLHAWALKIRELLQETDWNVERARELIQRTIQESGQAALSISLLERAKIIAVEEKTRRDLIFSARLWHELESPDPDNATWLNHLEGEELDANTTQNAESGNDAIDVRSPPTEDIMMAAGSDETAPTQDFVEQSAPSTRGTKRSNEYDTEDTSQEDRMPKRQRLAPTSSRRERRKGRR
ncbi:uncharacterized protein MYCFIDRAFT_200336 [Pseudocercospora fijiensis CIRAD86]|uniref:Uncharacterized protein n=1 Tax=Pseudocercospora fijiensis (strain CIRAD86) TaxID=383855 RepID=M2ZFP6_PSEFD|nr:uncharacterized protein MYCFIDRAFT_200336 [Pseudocercospora fijiensis CIRAD86]EME77969.1 hypothetical protein MYCFIDRAFT_200336 [Pseudocercospora fijiensis CIRAD86]